MVIGAVKVESHERSRTGSATEPMSRVSYTAESTVAGLGLGWIPMLVHGPIPQKYDVL